jgi:hypothetical protein
MAQDLDVLNRDLMRHSAQSPRVDWSDDRIIEHLRKSIAAH